MTVLDNVMKVDVTTFVSKMLPSTNAKSSEASMVVASVVGTITAVQLLTDWDPLGRCYTFWSQLRNHVSCLNACL
jgi:hypothetical protein